MGAQLPNLYNDPNLGQYFNQTTNTSPYFGYYTEPMNINATMPTSTLDSKGRPVKSKATSSFDNPSPLPNYSMYIAPSQMPNINAYLANPNSLLGAMQSAGIPISGAGRFSNSTNTGKTNV